MTRKIFLVLNACALFMLTGCSLRDNSTSSTIPTSTPSTTKSTPVMTGTQIPASISPIMTGAVVPASTSPIMTGVVAPTSTVPVNEKKLEVKPAIPTIPDKNKTKATSGTGKTNADMSEKDVQEVVNTLNKLIDEQ